MSGFLFEGPASALPEPIPRRHAVYRPISEIPTPVRHAAGYETFSGHVRTSGEDPSRLAGDLDLLLAFIRDHPDLAEEEELLDATAVFLGNTIIVTYPAASWRVLDEPQVGIEMGSGFAVRRIVEAVIAEPGRAEELVATLDRVLGAETPPA